MQRFKLFGLCLFLGIPVLSYAEHVQVERAKLIVSDSRLVDFISTIEAKYRAQCPLPEPEELEVEVKSQGSGDFAASDYMFNMLCTGNVELRNLDVMTEFVNMVNTPFDVAITVRFRR